MPTVIKGSDGRFYNFPEGTTPEAAREYVKRQGVEVDDEGDDFSFLEKFGYARSKTLNDVGKMKALINAHYPNELMDGNNYKSIEEKEWYYNEATPEQRLDFQRAQNERAAAAKYPKLAEAVQRGSATLGGAGVAGALTSELLSPTTLIPFGAGYKAAAIGGALLGAEWQVLEDAYKGQQLSLLGVAQGAAMGAAGGVGASALGRHAPKAYNALRSKGPAILQKNADNVVQDYNNAVTRALANSGLTDAQYAANPQAVQSMMHKVALDDMGFTEDTFLRYSKSAIVSPEHPASVMQARNAMEIVNDHKSAFNGKEGLMTDVLGSMSRSIERISPRLMQKVRGVDLAMHRDVAEMAAGAKPLADVADIAHKRFGKAFDGAWAREDYDAVVDMARRAVGKDKADAAFDAWRKVAAKDAARRMAADPNWKPKENYLPRRIQDYAKFNKYIGRLEPELLDKELMAWRTNSSYAKNNLSAVDKKLGPRAGMDEEAWRKFYNDKLVSPTHFNPLKRKGSAAQNARKIDNSLLDDDLVAANYVSDYNSLFSSVVNESVHDYYKKQVLGQLADSSDGSFGAWMREVEAGGESIVGDQAERVRELIATRFSVPASRQPNKIIQWIRNATYISTLANPITAMMQLQDVGTAMFEHSVASTTKALFRGKGIKGLENVGLETLGLGNTIMHEMQPGGPLAKWLDKALRVSGFTFADKLGKETLLNAAFDHGRSVATRIGAGNVDDAAVKRWMEKWKPRMGRDFEALLGDLRAGKTTELVKDYLYSGLADVQPVGAFEGSKAMLMYPNGRIMFQLKTFMLRHLNYLGREIVDNHKNAKDTTKKVARYLATVGMAGMTVAQAKKILSNEDVDPEELPEDFVMNLLKLMSVNQYTIETAKREGPVQAAIDLVAPPHRLFDDTFKAGAALLDGTPFNDGTRMTQLHESRLWNHLPLIGKFYYNWFGGGKNRNWAESGTLQQQISDGASMPPSTPAPAAPMVRTPAPPMGAPQGAMPLPVPPPGMGLLGGGFR